MPTPSAQLESRGHVDPGAQPHDRVAQAAELERVCARAGRHGFPLGLVTITLTDVPVAMVPQLAASLAQGVRTADCMVRTGPGTLALVLSPDDVEHADRVMQRLGTMVADYQHLHAGTGWGAPAMAMTPIRDAASLRTALGL
ncbi:MAG TPA: hypothetical protein VFH27_13905 [Longimicrobiaceae bacterium]|nr:hypothetical protein [Longimicrobiaceae bacterium]